MSWEKDDGRSDYKRYGNNGHNDHYSRNEERQLDYDRGFRQARNESELRRYLNQKEEYYWNNQDDDKIEYYIQMENEYYENHFYFNEPPIELFLE